MRPLLTAPEMNVVYLGNFVYRAIFGAFVRIRTSAGYILGHLFFGRRACWSKLPAVYYAANKHDLRDFFSRRVQHVTNGSNDNGEEPPSFTREHEAVSSAGNV